MKTDPSPEHAWLMQLVGTWNFAGSCVMGPDGETAESSGRDVTRAVGDLWVLSEMEGEMPDGGKFIGMMMLGYDPLKGKFVGAWIASPSTHMYLYEGSLNDDKTTLTLDCEGPDFMDPTKMASYQDIVELPGDGTRVLRSRLRGPDGEWMDFMRSVYTRES